MTTEIRQGDGTIARIESTSQELEHVYGIKLEKAIKLMDRTDSAIDQVDVVFDRVAADRLLLDYLKAQSLDEIPLGMDKGALGYMLIELGNRLSAALDELRTEIRADFERELASRIVTAARAEGRIS